MREAAAQLPEEPDDEESVEDDSPLTDRVDEDLYDTEESEALSHAEA